MEYPDINTKINYIFEIPVTEALKQKLGDAIQSEPLIEKSLKQEILPNMLDFIRQEFPHFEGRFVVTKTGDLIKGQFRSESIVKTSMDNKAVKELTRLLNEYSGGTDAYAKININCFF